MTVAGVLIRRCTSRFKAHRSPMRNDRGDTLIEILLTIVVLGLTAVALLIAFSTAISSSAEHRDLAVGDSVLRSVAESLVSQFPPSGTALQTCGSEASMVANYNSPGLTLPSVPSTTSPYALTYSARVSSVAFWNGSTFPSPPSAGACKLGYPQQLTVQVMRSGIVVGHIDIVVSGNVQLP